MKQTAVEWLENELKKLPYVNVIDIFKQAKEMEEEKLYEAKCYWFGRGILAGKSGSIKELKPKK
jgi:hypothetical protein